MEDKEKELLAKFMEMFNCEDIGSLSGEFEYWWFTNGDKVEKVIEKITTKPSDD